MQSNKISDINDLIMPGKRKISYSKKELDESNKNNSGDNFEGYLKDNSGKSIKKSKKKKFRNN